MIKKYVITLLVPFIFVGCSYNQDNISLPILPKPQSVVKKNGELKISKNTITFGRNDFRFDIIAPLRNTFKTLLSDYYDAELININQSNIKINIKKIHDREIENILIPKKFVNSFKSDGYLLEVNDTSLIIEAPSESGAFYGLQTLKQLLIAYRDKGELPLLKIVDYPQLKFRGLMDDISRGPIPNMDYMKYQIRRLSELKYNYLTYYIENVVKTKSHPEFAPADALTIDEIRELSVYAKKYYITLIGNFQSFGHFEKILSHPEYAHLGVRGKLLNPAKEESYKFLSDIYSELIPAFDSPYFIVNCDETFDLGKGSSKALVDSLGYAEVYKMHILRLYEIVKSYNKKMVIWGDVILKYPQLLDELPKDIIIGTWDYSQDVNIKELVDPFVDNGFQTIFVPGVLNSRRLFPDYNTTLKNIDFIKDIKDKEHILGAMLSIWDDGGFAFFSNDWYGVAYASQNAWNSKNILIKEFDNLYCKNFILSNNSSFTSAIHQLNKLSMLIPTYLMNYKVLKIISIDEKASMININLTEWNQVKVITSKVDSLLEKIGRINKPGEVESLQFINDLYSTLAKEKLGLGNIIDECKQTENCSKPEKVNEVKEYVKLISGKYKDLLDKLDKLWLYENRDYYLKNVRALIQDRIENINLLPEIFARKSFKVNSYKGKYFTEWLATNPIRVSSIKDAHENLLKEIGNENTVRPQVASEFELNGYTYRWRRIDSRIESVNNIQSDFVPFVEYFYATISNDTLRNVEIILSSIARAKVWLNDKVILDDFLEENIKKAKEIKNIKLLNKKNTLMIKLFSEKPNLDFLFSIKNLRIGGRKNKYKVLK
ncbi:beta-hexosaminidase [bacterium BMS3Abin04]|nr:beta-hexosaminidase [bacterium BMS3Abin04]